MSTVEQRKPKMTDTLRDLAAQLRENSQIHHDEHGCAADCACGAVIADRIEAALAALSASDTQPLTDEAIVRDSDALLATLEAHRAMTGPHKTVVDGRSEVGYVMDRSVLDELILRARNLDRFARDRMAQQAQPPCYCGVQPDGSVKHKAMCQQAQPTREVSNDG